MYINRSMLCRYVGVEDQLLPHLQVRPWIHMLANLSDEVWIIR